MTDTHAMLTPLRQVADPAVVAAIEALVRDAPDAELARVNPLAFAERHGFGEQPVVAAFLHAARLGLFDLSWNVLCPSCGGVLDANTTLKSVHADEYYCAFCAAGHEPTLDEMVEVAFTVNSRLRRIAAHDPSTLSLYEYMRQIFLSSGVALPADPERCFREAILDEIELPPGEKAILSLQLPPGTVILFDPVTHGTQFIEIGGEPTNERQTLSHVFSGVRTPPAPAEKLRPGPLRLSLENRSPERVLPGLWLASGESLHHFIGHRRPFLTAKRLLSNQTFRDLYGTDTLDIDQRLKITSLTFLFTDLRSSTAMYERVGDLAAYDLVRAHFRVLSGIVAGEAGAVVKTIGDAVMATFPTPGRAVAAALRMREAMFTVWPK
jgi:hypothetical protein